MHNIRIFLRSRILSAAAFLLSALLIVLTLACGGVQKDNIEYALILALFTGLLFAALDFFREKREDRKPFTEREAELAKENAGLKAELAVRETAYNGRVKEMQDYYALWAHQVKTPIAALNLILQNSDFAEKDECKAELFRITQYTDMAMNYVSVFSDSTDFLIRKYDLDPIIRQELKKYSSQFMLQKLTLTYTPCCLEVLTDKKQLSFVIGQLISNALKYTRTGGVSICPVPSGFAIRDTGIGISASDLPRIFEKGYTGTNGRSGAFSSGIGLYLCRCILTKLGHQISAASEPGRGSVFTVTFSQEKREIE